MKLLCWLLLVLPTLSFSYETIEQFSARVETTYSFKHGEILSLLRSVKPNQEVLSIYRHPNRAKKYEKYELYFIGERKIANGVKFWNEYEEQLRTAEELYGIQVDVLVALIGVETNYGSNTGKFKVLDTLTTLGFYGVRRQRYFQQELEQFLVVCRELNWKRKKITGSFAGAIGIPQFMPSNIPRYAVDFNNDGEIDIIDDKADAIGSVAKYLHDAGWQRSEPIAKPYIKAIHHTGRIFRTRAPLNYWLVTDNFKVIKRYNPSTTYVQSIFGLAERIKERRAMCGPEDVRCAFP